MTKPMKNVKRTVPLSDSEYDVLRDAFEWQSVTTDVLVALISKIAEKRAQDQRKAWDSVYRLSHTQMGDRVQIDWVGRCIVVGVWDEDGKPKTWDEGDER